MSMAKFDTRLDGALAPHRADDGHSGFNPLGSLRWVIKMWRQRAAERRSLQGVTARDLRDAGLSPSQVEFEIAQPFWRPLSRLGD